MNLNFLQVWSIVPQMFGPRRFDSGGLARVRVRTHVRNSATRGNNRTALVPIRKTVIVLLLIWLQVALLYWAPRQSA
jgi:hypothetical protein